MNIQTNTISQSHYNNAYSLHRKQSNDFTEIADVKDKDVEKIVSKQDYDVRNATFKELNTIAKELVDSGEISKKEYVVMVFDYSIIERHNKVADLRSGNRTPLNTQNNAMFQGYDGKSHDWIKLFEIKANQQFSLGNRDGGNCHIKIKNALESLSKNNK